MFASALTSASSCGPYPRGAAGLRGGPGGGGGQREDHGEPAAGGIFGFHGAAHRLDQAAGYREAEPDAGSVARVAESAEGPEHPVTGASMRASMTSWP